MSVKEIRVALIGHQFMGITHSNAYRNAAMWTDLPVKITMKCLCANDTMNNLKVFAAKYGWESCETDWRNVVKCDDVDLISIAAPNYLHKEIAIEAAINGKHILCEKPLANNLSDSKEVLDAVKREGKYRDTPPTPQEFRKLTTRIVNLHPITCMQNTRTSSGGVVTDIPTKAITVGPVQTWKAEKVSIWHAGTHDNPFGQRLTALMIGKKIMDSSVPMSLLVDHLNVQFNYYRGGIGVCETLVNIILQTFRIGQEPDK